MTKRNETEVDETEEQFNGDFDLSTDAKAEPLIPNGNYTGSVVEVKLVPEKSKIQWKIALNGNGGFMNDGETPVDGANVFFSNWLPKKGDETEPAANGRGTKWQNKVNMLKAFADAMQLGDAFNTIPNMKAAIEGGEWIGMDVMVTINVQEYPKGSGKYSNSVDKMILAS